MKFDRIRGKLMGLKNAKLLRCLSDLRFRDLEEEEKLQLTLLIKKKKKKSDFKDSFCEPVL